MTTSLSEIFNTSTLFSEDKKKYYLTKKSLILKLYKGVNIKEIKDKIDSYQIFDIIDDLAQVLCDKENTDKIFANILNTLISKYKDININLFDFRLSEPHGTIELHALSNEDHKYHEELLELEDYIELYNFINSAECNDEAMEDVGTQKFIEETFDFINELVYDFLKKVIPQYFTKESLSKLDINYPLSFYFNEEYREAAAWEGPLLHTLGE
ncbi:hypothetical protein [Aquimarina sp. AU58]|uniref:hypothetical protein n=1 Tax=Aquimarina sp. AU58 TaxID=1874112 RepID=UPI000D646F42|nr:hypothetical protein [Aquimarina sp. AU58]